MTPLIPPPNTTTTHNGSNDAPPPPTNNGTTGAPASAEPVPPQIYLSPSTGVKLEGGLGWLVQQFNLDSYGPRLLTECAGKDLKYMAVMLAVIVLFDWLAWSLFWTMVINAGRLEIGWSTPFALFCGGLFAAIVFCYERYFITADTSKGNWRVFVAAGLRVVVIAITAAITTQPIEVAIFYGAVQRRAHEESVRAEALGKLRILQEAQKDAKSMETSDGTVDGKRVREAISTAKEAEDVANEVQARINRASNELKSAQASLAAAQNRRSRAVTQRQIDGANAAVGRAQSRISKASADLDQARVNQEKANVQKTTAEEARTQAEAPLKEQEEKAKTLEARVRNWISQVRTSKAGEIVTEKTAGNVIPWTFTTQDYDFVQRLNIISDLYAGRPARWPEANPEDIIKLGTEYGLGEAQDTTTIARRNDEARNFRWTYWAVVFVAAVIPLLIILAKLVLSPDLKRYYSREAQRQAGSYDELSFAVKNSTIYLQ